MYCQVAAFLATKLVAWDNRTLWMELLLRHEAPGSSSRRQLPLAALLLQQDAPEDYMQLPPICQTVVDMLLEVCGVLSTSELQVGGLEPADTCQTYPGQGL